MADVFHNWAHNVTGPRGGGTSYGNVFFERDTRIIYSYGRHFPMARIVENVRGETAVLFTTDTYSKTTASHMSSARWAVNHLPQFPVRRPENWRVERSDIDNLVNKAAETFAKAKRARKYADSYVSQAGSMLAKAREMVAFFDLDYNVPKTPSDKTFAKIIKAQEAAAKEAARLQREREAQIRLEQKAQFEAWMRNEYGVAIPYSYYQDENGSAYLRTHGDVVQTSRHADVPLAHAIRAYRFVKLCRQTGRTFKQNGHSVRIGHFTVQSIDAEGNMRIGCHYLTWERISEWATNQGIADAEISTDALLTESEV